MTVLWRRKLGQFLAASGNSPCAMRSNLFLGSPGGMAYHTCISRAKLSACTALPAEQVLWCMTSSIYHATSTPQTHIYCLLAMTMFRVFMHCNACPHACLQVHVLCVTTQTLRSLSCISKQGPSLKTLQMHNSAVKFPLYSQGSPGQTRHFCST